MNQDERQNLRAAATTAAKMTHPRSSVERALSRWSLQTSNSFRRIGTAHGDGDVLCATTHPIDGQPDLLAAPGVLDYIVASQPCAVIDLLDELDRCEDTLSLSRKQHAQDLAELEGKLAAVKVSCDRITEVDARLDQVAGGLTALGTMIEKSSDAETVAKARALVDKLTASLREATR